MLLLRCDIFVSVSVFFSVRCFVVLLFCCFVGGLVLSCFAISCYLLVACLMCALLGVDVVLLLFWM